MYAFIQKKTWSFVGILVGLAAGYLYYHFIGCNSGSCSITSSPVNSSLYGAFFGWVVFDMFNKPQKDDNQRNDT